MSVKPLAFIPEHDVVVPESLLVLAQGDSVRPVWVNGVGGVTFRMGEGTGRERYVKYAAAGTPESDFAREAETDGMGRAFQPGAGGVGTGGR